MSKIFKNESALRPEYIPDRLPFREEHLRKLTLYFSEFMRNPGSVCPKVVLYGRPGTGKTVTARKFGQHVAKLSEEVSGLRYVHVNCFINRTLFSALKDMSQQLKLPTPKRGLSVIEMMELLLEMVQEKDLYVIAVLDDVFHLVNHGGPDAIGNLIKLNEACINRGYKYRFGFVLISQDLSFIDQLDSSVRSILGSTFIEFSPYTKSQIFEILLDRARIAFYEHSYAEDILHMISDVAGADGGRREGSRGDARYAIDILWRAAKIAELKGSDKVLPEHVREAIKSTLVGIRYDELALLPLHMKLFLLSIVKSLKRNPERAYVMFGDVEETYHMICEEYGQTPRKHTKLWEYLRELKSKNIVETRPSGKGIRGRTTYISIPSEPLEALESELESLIKKDLGYER